MLYFSSSGIDSPSVVEAVSTLVAEGIRNIELSGGANFEEDLEERLLELKSRHSLNYLVHNYFPPPPNHFVLNVGSVDPNVRERSANFVKTAIRLAKSLGSQLYAMHAGYRRNFSPAKDRNAPFEAADDSPANAESVYQNMLLSLRNVKPDADQAGIKLGVENLFPAPAAAMPDSILCAPDELSRYLDDTQADGLGLLIDLGHLKIAARQLDFDADAFLRSLTNDHMHRIMEIHLSGNDGHTDQHGPLEDDDWQLSCLEYFDTRRIPVTIECRTLPTDQLLAQYQSVATRIDAMPI